MFSATPNFTARKPSIFLPQGGQAGTQAYGPQLPGNQQMGPNIFSVDEKAIENQVNQEIQQSKTKTFTKDDFKNQVQQVMDENNIDIDTSILENLKYYKKQGYTLKGVDIDQELSSLMGNTQTPQAQTEVPAEAPQEDKNFLQRAAGPIASGLAKTGGKILDVQKDIMGSAVANIPDALGDAGSLVVGKPIDKAIKGELSFGSSITSPTIGIANFAMKKLGLNRDDVPSLAESMQEDGDKAQQAIKDFLGVEEGLASDIGEFGSDVGLLFTPGGQTKLASKIPNAADKIKKAGETVNKLAETAPKFYNKMSEIAQSKIVQSAGKGAVEAGKFEAVSEGELSPTTLVLGAVANPALDWSGKVIKGVIGSEPTSNFMKAIRVGKKRFTKKGFQSKNAVEDSEIILGDIKTTGGTYTLNEGTEKQVVKKVDSMENLLEFSMKSMDDIYKKEINPALKKVKATSNMEKITDDVLASMSSSGKIGQASKEGLAGIKKESADDLIKMADEYKKLGKKASLQDLEATKVLLSSIQKRNASQSGNYSGAQSEFIEKMNKALQDEIDNKLTSVLGEKGATALKRRYAAYITRIDEIDTAIMNQAKKQNIDLFSGLGIISGATNIMRGATTGETALISSGLTSILTGKLLNFLKDPNELIKKAVQQTVSPTKTQKAVKGAVNTAGKSIKVGGPTQTSEYLDESDLLK